MSRIYLKLGGSLITDKTKPESVRHTVLNRLAKEIRVSLDTIHDLRLILGHGSGSFGHVAAARHQTRGGVHSREAWFGFTEVSDAALRLNRQVTSALLSAGVPAMSLSPSASATVADQKIRFLAVDPIEAALKNGLLPVIHGDVAFDSVRGGTILSTEEVITYLLGQIPAAWLLLAGETNGVYDEKGQTIPRITPAQFAKIAPALGGSRGTDVTGGMSGKVDQMLSLVKSYPHLKICIFSGLEEGALVRRLKKPDDVGGTIITAK